MRLILSARAWFLRLGLVAMATSGGAAVAEPMKLEEWMNVALAEGDTLAVAAFAVSDGRTLFYEQGQRTPGGSPTDRNTQFEIGSLTKVFTNLLLADLVAEGRVSYDTVIADLLPEAFVFDNAEVGRITLAQLATHRSGLPRLPANLAPSDPADPYQGYDEQRLLRGLASARPRQPLGSQYAYSNFGVGLLGHLLGEIDGRGYQQALTARVLSPLALSATGFTRGSNRAAAYRNGKVVSDWSMDDALAGAGGLISNVSDLARFAESLLGRHPGLDDALLRSVEPVVADTDIGFQLSRAWHVAAAPAGPVYWHNGGTGGFFSVFAYQPDSGRSLGILVSGGEDPTGYALDWFSAEVEAPEPPSPDESVMGQYALTPDIGVGVFVRDAQLMAQVSGQVALPLTPLGDDWYAYHSVDASLHFLREQGVVTGLELAQGGALQRAPRVAAQATIPDREAVSVSPEQLDDYVGEYLLAPGFVFTVRRTGEQLEAMLTGQPFLPIYAERRDVFFYKVVDAELHFERDANNRVKALVLHQGAVEQRAVKQPPEE